MKVLHVIPSLSPVHGGPSHAMAVIAKALVRAGVAVVVDNSRRTGAAHPEEADSQSGNRFESRNGKSRELKAEMLKCEKLKRWRWKAGII